MADIRQKAVATADAYNAGNIASLDDATTRRLIASTVLSESRGGDPDVVDRLGFVGRYKAGAAFLAAAGYLDQDKLDRAMSGQRSEWAWARTGGMAEFLQDPGNWKQGLSLDAYKASPELQDRAFRTNAERDYARAREQGFIGDDEKPARVAGFLKAAHIVGFNSAREAMTGGRAYRDPNGVSNYDRIHDITRNGDGLDRLMAPDKRGPAVEGAAGALAGTLADAAHPDHGRFRAVYDALGAVPGMDNDEARRRAAGSILVAARAGGLETFDHIVAGPPGTVFAVRGDLGAPSQHVVPLNLAQLTAQSLDTSTAQFAALAPGAPAQAAPSPDRGRGL